MWIWLARRLLSITEQRNSNHTIPYLNRGENHPFPPLCFIPLFYMYIIQYLFYIDCIPSITRITRTLRLGIFNLFTRCFWKTTQSNTVCQITRKFWRIVISIALIQDKCIRSTPLLPLKLASVTRSYRPVCTLNSEQLALIMSINSVTQSSSLCFVFFYAVLVV